MKRINILHIVSSFNPSEGGPPRSIENLASSLNNKKFHNSLLTSSNIKIKNNYFNKIYKGKLLFDKFYFPSFFNDQINLETGKENHIIHLHNYWNFVIFFCSSNCNNSKKQIILTPHGSLDKFNIKKSFFKKIFFFTYLETSIKTN